MNLSVASSPHIRGTVHTRRLMLDVVLALLPALAVGVWVMGLRALWIAALSIASAVTAQGLCDRLSGKESSWLDGSAVVTGLLFAMTLPVTIPVPVVICGSVFGAVAGKCLCGGLGRNPMNPALLGRAFVMLLFPAALTQYPLDGISSATPLHKMAMSALPESSLTDLFLGAVPGSMGETSALALLIGGGYLLVRKVISPRIPLSYLGTAAVLSLAFHRTDHAFLWMLSSLLSGGILLGAIFMATDYATAPVTPVGQILYGAGCGALTVFFRSFGLFPEGVTYAILGMNLLTWSLDRMTPPRRFGTGKGAKL